MKQFTFLGDYPFNTHTTLLCCRTDSLWWKKVFFSMNPIMFFYGLVVKNPFQRFILRNVVLVFFDVLYIKWVRTSSVPWCYHLTPSMFVAPPQCFFPLAWNPSFSLFCFDSTNMHVQDKMLIVCHLFLCLCRRIWMPIELKKHGDIRFDMSSLYRPQCSRADDKMTQFPQWSKETCSKTISVENSHFKLSCGAIAYISPLVSSVKWQLMSFINMLNRPFSPGFARALSTAKWPALEYF